MRKSVLFNEDGTVNEDLIPENTNEAVGRKFDLGICPICGADIKFRVEEVTHLQYSNCIIIRFNLGCPNDNKWSITHETILHYDKNGDIEIRQDERQIAIEEFTAAISDMSAERLKQMIKRYENGMNVIYEGHDEQDGIYCPNCKEMVAINDEDYKPKHCPECGVKLIY